MPDELDFNIEKYKRRLRKAGASNVSHHMLGTMDAVAVQFKLVITKEKETLGSLIEMTDEGKVELAVIRYPALDMSGDQDTDIYNRIKDTLIDAVAETIYLQYQFGVIQTPNIQLNMKGPYSGGAVVPHLEFRRNREGFARVNRDELVPIIHDTKEAWERELFDVDTRMRSIYRQ